MIYAELLIRVSCELGSSREKADRTLMTTAAISNRKQRTALFREIPPEEIESTIQSIKADFSIADSTKDIPQLGNQALN